LRKRIVSSGIDSNFGLSDEQIYTIIMLHRYQRMHVNKIGRRFGISTAQVRKLISRRTKSECCG